MAEKQKTPEVEVTVPKNPIETAPVAVTEPPSKPKRTKAKAAVNPDGWVEVPPEPKPTKRKAATKTLADVFAGYLKSIEDRGGSDGTIASYRMELELAGKALGADTPVSLLSDNQVATFFESDPVTKKRNGKPKSPLSIDKTRRVLRQALVWGGHADLVPTEVAP